MINQDKPVFGTTFEAMFVDLFPDTTYTVNVYPFNDEGGVGEVTKMEATTGIRIFLFVKHNWNSTLS